MTATNIDRIESMARVLAKILGINYNRLPEKHWVFGCGYSKRILRKKAVQALELIENDQKSNG